MEFLYFIAGILSIFLFVLNVRAMLAVLDIRKRLKDNPLDRSYWIEKRMGNNEKACELLTRLYYSEEYTYMMSGRSFPEKNRRAYKGSFAELGYPEKYDELASN